MIHFAQAVRGQPDLGRMMIKQMGEALDSAQPEVFTEAMFKLAALLISTKGFTFSVLIFAVNTRNYVLYQMLRISFLNILFVCSVL